MKNRFYILTIVLVILSCSLDDDTQQTSPSMLNGEWSLVNASGGFSGANNDFEDGFITWKFEDTYVIITNNNTDPINTGFLSGVYPYEVVTTANDTTFLFGQSLNTDYMKIRNLTDSQFIIEDDPLMVIDGSTYTFSK